MTQSKQPGEAITAGCCSLMRLSEAKLPTVAVPFNLKSKYGTAECPHPHVMTGTRNLAFASTLLLVCDEQPLQLLMIEATAAREQQQCHTLNRSGFFMGQTTSSWIRRLA